MTVHIITPYSTERNLGKAYNEAMELIPDNDAACFIDGDVLFLTPDYGHIIHEYANKYPEAVLTCWCNRIHELAKGQRYPMVDEDRNDIKACIQEATLLSKADRTVEVINGAVSGFLLVVPKSVWKQHRFCETNMFRPDQPNLLGCDNEWTNRIRSHGVKVLRMNAVLCWHTYRILDGSKNHLLNA